MTLLPWEVRSRPFGAVHYICNKFSIKFHSFATDLHPWNMPKLITSTQNPLIRDIILLTEKSRERKSRNLIVIEGRREVRLALSSGFRIRTFLFCKEVISVNILNELIGIPATTTDIIEVSENVYNKIAYRKDYEGIIAIAEPKWLTFNNLDLRTNPLILVVETVEKPGNLGALLRTADAANLDAVIICDPQTDIYNPNAIRSSIGCIFTIPVVTCTGEEAIIWLRSKKITSFATALTAEKFYHETDLSGPSAIIMGSEAEGLSETWLSNSDFQIKIPMGGKIDSMNVSTSAAIVIFEALRQRKFSF
jgi:RNA methyltransferase, TrmH family